MQSYSARQSKSVSHNSGIKNVMRDFNFEFTGEFTSSEKSRIKNTVARDIARSEDSNNYYGEDFKRLGCYIKTKNTYTDYNYTVKYSQSIVEITLTGKY